MPGGDLEADFLQGFAQGFFGHGLAQDAQGFLLLVFEDRAVPRAADVFAGIAEGQGGAVLDIALHPPVARFEGAELDAAQPQAGPWLQVVDQALVHFKAASP
ncbi:hypothetical protein D3C80_816150 [compost metagenome]